MKRTNLIVLLGLVALVAGGSLVILIVRKHNTSNSTSKSAVAGGPNGGVTVVVASQPLSQGATGDDLVNQVAVHTATVPVAQRQAGALSSLDELRGRILIAAVASGAQVLSSDLQAPVRTVKVPDGKQGLAVSVPFFAGGAGYVRANDVVNVYANLTGLGKTAACTELVVPNIQVLDVNQEIAPQIGTAQTAPSTSGGSVRPSGSSLTYLLAVDPSEAQAIIFMLSNESLYLTLTQKGQTAPTALSCAGYPQLLHRP